MALLVSFVLEGIAKEEVSKNILLHFRIETLKRLRIA
jgi:hypothetical protein